MRLCDTQVNIDGTVLMNNVTDDHGGQYKCIAVSSAYRQIDQWTTNIVVASQQLLAVVSSLVCVIS